MYARIVNMKLKDEKRVPDFTKLIETEVIPMLRMQEGFQDEVSLFSKDRLEVRGISFWKKMENAETYHKNVYPQILKTISGYVDGTPEIRTFEVGNSTLHNLTV